MCPLVMCVLRVPLLLPEELCPPLQLSLCSEHLLLLSEPHRNQFVHPNLWQPLWNAEPSQQHGSNLRLLGSALVSRCSSNPRTPALAGGATETQRGEVRYPRSHSKAKMRAQLTPLTGHQLPQATLTPGLCPCPAPAAQGGRERVKGPALASRNKLPLFTEQEGAKCRALMVSSGNDGELSDRSQLPAEIGHWGTQR